MGALIGYGLLRAYLTHAAFGIVFGMVSGMMVFICFQELIPTAHKYDPSDRLVTAGVFTGMAFMALSLVLFQI